MVVEPWTNGGGSGGPILGQKAGSRVCPEAAWLGFRLGFSPAVEKCGTDHARTAATKVYQSLLELTRS